jgi:hypothetical protein
MSNTNAKAEFLQHTKDTGKVVKAVDIKIGYYNEDELKPIILKVGYSDEDYEEFLSSLDFMYSSGYGSQELYGTIWYVGNTWSSRGEYDGSEWWDYNRCPKIPKELK